MTKPKQLQENIIDLVINKPECLSSYAQLVANYWQDFEGATDISDVSGCTSPESITRAFRQLVKFGLITLPEDIQKVRREKEKEYREKYSPSKNTQTFISASAKAMHG